MDAAAHYLDLARVPPNIILVVLQSMSLIDRFTCALVCKAWAEAAAAATHSIVLRHTMFKLNSLQCWMEKHGGQIEVLQLHNCHGAAALTALPCVQLQDLLLTGCLVISSRFWHNIDRRVWSDIAAATKLTSVSLERVQTASQQSDVVSALTALPDLQQLTWSSMECGGQQGLTDSMLLHKLTKLTALKLNFVRAAEALEHLGRLTRLQHLSIAAAADWAAAGCPVLQELKALTRLELLDNFDGVPASVSRLTALQQLYVGRATSTALNPLSALTGLTHLCVFWLDGLSSGSAPLRLPSLQHLEVVGAQYYPMPASFLGSCTQLQVLKLGDISLDPGSLATSTKLQHVKLQGGLAHAAYGAADPVSWQQVFPGAGRLPHLTSLQFTGVHPDLQQADVEWVVACCSSLQVLHLETLPDNSASALACLSGLTSLALEEISDQQCSSLAQLTGLRELTVNHTALEVSAAGLRQLAALEQLTSLKLNSLGWSSRMLREHMSDGPPRGYWSVMINKV